MNDQRRFEDIVREDLDVRASDETYDRIRDIVLSEHGPTRITESAMPILKGRTIMRNPIAKLAVAAGLLVALGLGVWAFVSTGSHSGVVWAQVVKNMEASPSVIFRARHTGSRDPNDDWPNGHTIFWRSATVSRMDKYRGGQIHRTIYTNLDAKTVIGVLHDRKAYSKEAMSEERVQQARAGWGWSAPQELINLARSLEHHALGQKTVDGVLCEGIEATGPDGSTGRLWVAVETGYPILAEIEAMKGGVRTTGTLDQFRWNVDLSAAGVEPEIPAGYYESFGTWTLRPRTSSGKSPPAIDPSK